MSPRRSPRPLRAALLDRDGTINVKAPEGAYVTAPADVALLPGAAEAIASLNAARVPVVVVTNQRGIALGQMTAADVAAVHDRLHELLAEQGARVDAIFVCPHDRGVCACRKPGTLMLERARDLLRLDSLRDCVMIGDSPTDVLAGRAAGARSVYLGAASDSMVPRGVEVAGSLLEAVQRMLETHPQTAAAAA